MKNKIIPPCLCQEEVEALPKSSAEEIECQASGRDRGNDGNQRIGTLHI